MICSDNMPYKNTENRKQYQREWYQRKKSGKPTRITPILTEEKRRELERYRNKKYYNHKREILQRKFGSKCFFCENDVVRIIHRKDGKPHKKFEQMTIMELEKLDENEYVCVCGICHKGIHWVMKYIGLSWNNLVGEKA